MKVKSLSCGQLLATPWTAAYQASPSMGFSRQEYWSGVPLEGSGWGTHAYLWQIHFDIWKNQYNIVKLNKIKLKKKFGCNYGKPFGKFFRYLDIIEENI